MTLHRKKLQTYNLPGHAHELTFSCFHRLPLLNQDRSRPWFLDALAAARTKLNLDLWAYVIMPEHVHVLLRPRDSDYEMRLIRTALKVPVQRRALSFLRKRAPRFLDRLRDEQPNGDVHFRFWQRGGGFDRNVTDGVAIRNMIEYFHFNPVRRGLVKDATEWRWSSAGFYARMDDVNLEMDPLPCLD